MYFAGKIYPVLCLAGKMKYICWETFSKNFLLNGHCRRKAVKMFSELWTIFEKCAEIMDFHEVMHTIHSCYAAGWEKYYCHLPGSEEHVLLYQGRQLCDDKQASSVLVKLKLIIRYF